MDQTQLFRPKGIPKFPYEKFKMTKIEPNYVLLNFDHLMAHACFLINHKICLPAPFCPMEILQLAINQAPWTQGLPKFSTLMAITSTIGQRAGRVWPPGKVTSVCWHDKSSHTSHFHWDCPSFLRCPRVNENIYFLTIKCVEDILLYWVEFFFLYLAGATSPMKQVFSIWGGEKVKRM